MNLLGLMIYFFKSSNLPDIINNIILLNMRICPCVFLISDILYNDIIVSNYDVIKRIKTIFIDKTGTLTDSIKITKFFLESKIKKIVIFLELKYQNIYSKGILEVFKASKHYNLIVEQDEYISTCGIRCKYKNNEIRIGKYSFCNYKNITHNYNINNNCIYVSVESKIAGFFHITSYVKKDAKNFINILKRFKKNVVKVCHYLNITDYYYNITSEDKANVINNTQEMNCMIGDGFNDIPAFQRSNLSISMNNNLKADFCVNNDLKNILCILDIIRITNFKKI
ncbi:cation transporting p-type atpase [Vairimorpha apis BRL 01]|uniref:Cation transporting P-type atpase n=1 Tax=Vairimorpha apis BRL 01 TaxID=1037528 RepID=T0L8T6_9MICR|nr:cation transporting p-type atpase [Vairimorpha apis BRL 01]